MGIICMLLCIKCKIDGKFCVLSGYYCKLVIDVLKVIYICYGR